MGSARLTGIVLLVATTRALAVDITACGQTVPSGQTGVLQTDLHCTGMAYAIPVGIRSTLDLNGHTLSGEPGWIAGADTYGVVCTERSGCTILGPGEISGFDYCVYEAEGGRLDLHDLDVHDCEIGVFGPDRRINATNLTVSDNSEHGIVARDLRGSNITSIRNAHIGILVVKARVTTLTASENGAYGMRASRILRGTDVTLRDNGGPGVFADRVHGTRLVAGGNVDAGVFARRVVLLYSDVTGNNGFQAGIDLTASERPRLTSTTCGKSIQSSGNPFGPSWGVCAQD